MDNRVGDLHEGNFGYIGDRMVIVDFSGVARMTTWEDFQKLCEDIKQNPDKYTWIALDPIEGVSFRKENENGEN